MCTESVTIGLYQLCGKRIALIDVNLPKVSAIVGMNSEKIYTIVWYELSWTVSIVSYEL